MEFKLPAGEYLSLGDAFKWKIWTCVIYNTRKFTINRASLENNEKEYTQIL